jgi:hypothetical protein
MAKKKKYTEKVLDNYKKILVAELKKELNKPGSNLEKSIVGEKIKNRIGFTISMNEYGLNVNQGRSAGKLPNMYNLQDWIDRNQSKLGIKDATPKGIRKVLFAIGNSIKKRGIRPHRFIDIVIDKFEPRLTLDLADAYRREIQEEIDAVTSSAKKG